MATIDVRQIRAVGEIKSGPRFLEHGGTAAMPVAADASEAEGVHGGALYWLSNTLAQLSLALTLDGASAFHLASNCCIRFVRFLYMIR